MVVLHLICELIVLFSVTECVRADDPCNTRKVISDYRRSVAFGTDSMKICDNTIQSGWYRITSGAGEQMPTECVVEGYRCNTEISIWLSNDTVPPGEELFPTEGLTVNRTAYSSNLYECKSNAYRIQIKGCPGYLVYNLVPTTGCVSAYCFGDQLPCPAGESSETGFTPGCGSFPKFSRKPFVTSELKELPGHFKGQKYIFSNITFLCRANDLDDVYQYDVRWYITGIELKSAKQKNLSKASIQNGEALLHQEHWTSLYRPNFIVKCSLSTRGTGYGAPGPENFSNPFFAGIKTNQTEYEVSETKTLNIPVWLTVPIPCGWPVRVTGTEKKRYIDQCHLNLLNGIPRYQQDTNLCSDGISNVGLTFDNHKCGIAFSHSNWDEVFYLNITGAADNRINLKDRIVFLRLYNNPRNSIPNAHFVFMFTGISLPDLKVIIHDGDKITLGKSCSSVNDPHMTSFDGHGYWELQYREFGVGEFIMYQHVRLPLQINAFFQQCNGATALCNCGLAIRSGDSLFVANFCETTYRRERKVNRYIVEQLCDEESLVVSEVGNTIKVTLPTGTEVRFSHGKVYHFYGIHSINIYPSTLDVNNTRGLCGVFNGNPNDDFVPRGHSNPADRITFAKSWKVSGENKELSLFDPSGKLPKTKYYGQQYCTCKVNDTSYPYENASFSCNLTSSMKTCRSAKSTESVIRTSCATAVYNNGRFRRSIDTENEEDQFPRFPLSDDDAAPQNETAVWRNGWTEESARDFCTNGIHNAPNFGPCIQHVSYLNTTTYITTCILDIKYQGGTEWIEATLAVFSSNCLKEASKSENLTTSMTTDENGETVTILELIEGMSCPNNCSGNGVCVKGECNCTDEYFSYDCGLQRSTRPDIIREAFDGQCDTTKRPCRKFTIPGLNFMKGSLVCNFMSYSMIHNGTETAIVFEEALSYPGIYKSSFLMYCELPPSRQKRSSYMDVIATVYNITISNNGENFTEELTVMVYDSTCYDCNMSSLTCDGLDKCQSSPKDREDKKLTSLIIVLAAVAFVVLMFSLASIWSWQKLKIRKYVISKKSLNGFPKNDWN